MRVVKSLRGRLAVMVAVAIIVTGTVVLLYGYFIARSVFREQLLRSMDGIVSRTIREIDTANGDGERISAVIASNTRLRQGLEAYLNAPGGGAAAAAEIEGVLLDAQLAIPSYCEIRVLSTDGTTIASVSNCDTSFPPTVGVTAARDPAGFDEPGRTAVDFTVIDGLLFTSLARGVFAPGSPPESGGGGPNGILVVNARATGIEAAVADTAGLGASGEILLSRRGGAYVQVVDVSGRGKGAGRAREATLPLAGNGSLPEVKAALGESGNGDAVDAEGRGVVASYGPVSQVAWGVTAQESTRDAFAPIYGLRNTIIAVIIVLLAGGALLAYLIARSITRPLVELQEGVKLLAGGRLTTRVAVRDGIEIAALADEFNLMAARLNELYQNLEAKVAERTVELEDANERLKELDGLKSEFVSIVSHELRSPLASMKMGISSVAGGLIGPLNDEQKVMLDIADRNVDRLTKLTTDLLDFARIEARGLELELAECDIVALAREVVESALPQAKEQGLELRVVSGTGAVSAACDRDRLYQVIQNLVGNALKFTVRGGITVTVDPDRERPGTVTVCVEDTGPGIPPDALETVFDKFSQAHIETCSEKRGTGLGLAISKGIVEAHGGAITVESAPGSGCTFCFTVPVEGPGGGSGSEDEEHDTDSR